MTNRIVLVLFIATVSGCATPRLAPIEYGGAVAHKSELAAHVQANTGKVTGYSSSTMIYAGGGIFVPITTGPVPELQFGEEDQEVFLESLKTELVRHGIVKSVSENDEGKVLEVTLDFVQTEHFPKFQEYKITALLLLKFGETMRDKRYSILSSEGDTAWSKFNTSASEGKTKAAEKLLAAVIPDIEEFVSRLPQ